MIVIENPRRPPKKWMRDCVRGASKSARNPGAVCGALWYHKMSESDRRAALRREGKDESDMLENAEPAGTLLAIAIGAVVIFGAAWLLKKPNASSGSGSLSPSSPSSPSEPQPEKPNFNPPPPPKSLSYNESSNVYTYEILYEYGDGRWQKLWENGYWYSGPAEAACREPNTDLFHALAPPYQLWQVWIWYPNSGWERSQADSNYKEGPHTCFGVQGPPKLLHHPAFAFVPGRERT